MSDLTERTRREAEELLGNRQRKTLRDCADEIQRLTALIDDLDVWDAKQDERIAELEQDRDRLTKQIGTWRATNDANWQKLMDVAKERIAELEADVADLAEALAENYGDK